MKFALVMVSLFTFMFCSMVFMFEGRGNTFAFHPSLLTTEAFIQILTLFCLSPSLLVTYPSSTPSGLNYSNHDLT